MYENKNDDPSIMIAMILGLLIGGLLVWAFSGPTSNEEEIIDENNYKKQAFDACLTNGGIPIVNRDNRLEQCQSVIK